LAKSTESQEKSQKYVEPGTQPYHRLADIKENHIKLKRGK